MWNVICLLESDLALISQSPSFCVILDLQLRSRDKKELQSNDDPFQTHVVVVVCHRGLLHQWLYHHAAKGV
jgi:hypothetical protein